VDIYFCHRPDTETPIEETARAMDDLIHRGKVLYWGTSEWSAEQIREAREVCEKRNLYAPAVEQPQLHLAARKRYQQEIQPELTVHGMGAVTWSPLASGLLSGKYDGGALPEGARLWRSENLRKSYLTDKNRTRAEKMKAIADSVGVPRAQLAIAWCMAQPGVTSVITGATKLEQLKQNLGALKVKITPEVNAQLDELFPSDA
jgi:aryl-alcohol dehydrogenase-like predicted oxidoreductase